MAEPTPALSQLNNKPLREQVLDALREAIVEGELRPGQSLVENDLASRLGTSRAPLREALQILNTEGLIETVPYHGTTVRRLSKLDIEELYGLRSVLEGFAIRRAIAHRQPGDVELLRAHIAAMLEAAAQGDIKRVNQIDRLFHTTLIELSRHQLLMQIWGMVTLRVRQVMALLNERNSDLRQIAYNHTPIVDAIAAGDEELALRLIQQHVATTGELIAEGWVDPETGTAE